MNKVCPHCGKNFETTKGNKIYCTYDCQSVYNARKHYGKIKRGEAVRRNHRNDWKYAYIRSQHASKLVENIAGFIKMPVEDVKDYCTKHSLRYTEAAKYRPKDIIGEPREHYPPPPKNDYDNIKNRNVYRYQNYLSLLPHCG